VVFLYGCCGKDPLIGNTGASTKECTPLALDDFGPCRDVEEFVRAARSQFPSHRELELRVLRILETTIALAADQVRRNVANAVVPPSYLNMGAHRFLRAELPLQMATPSEWEGEDFSENNSMILTSPLCLQQIIRCLDSTSDSLS
jgi:hypothetical protein